jgi:hypothetical protein
MDVTPAEVDFILQKYHVVTKTLALSVDGAYPDLRTYSYKFTVRDVSGGSDQSLSFVTLGNAGSILIAFPYSFTSISSTYDYDLYIISAGVPSRILKGKIVVEPAISVVTV